MIRICVLPVAGKEDPTQMLMMDAVGRSGHYEMRHGVDTRFFAATRTILRYRPQMLYFDWIGRYHIGRSRIITLAKILAFVIDVQIATRVFRQPIVWSLHNLRSHEQGSECRWEMAMQRYFARHAAIIRVFSHRSMARAAELLGVAKGKLRVLPVGNYIDYYPNQISREAARGKLGLDNHDFVLLWLGSIRPYKGLQELIDVFHRTAPPRWRLVIVGKPFIESYAREITALAQTDARIRLHLGFVPNTELQIYYNAADALALPFVEVENTSSLVVAMGFRKPIVAPNLGVIGERLCRQPELVYEAGGLEGALHQLASLAPARLAEIGAANYEEVAKHQWSDLAKVFQEIESSRS